MKQQPSATLCCKYHLSFLLSMSSPVTVRDGVAGQAPRRPLQACGAFSRWSPSPGDALFLVPRDPSSAHGYLWVRSASSCQAPGLPPVALLWRLTQALSACCPCPTHAGLRPGPGSAALHSHRQSSWPTALRPDPRAGLRSLSLVHLSFLSPRGAQSSLGKQTYGHQRGKVGVGRDKLRIED